MKFSLFSPPVHLKDVVKCFWKVESTDPNTVPKEFYLMADGNPEVIFQFNGGLKKYANYKAYIRPQHTLNAKLEVGSSIGLFGIRLHPGALQQLMNVPANELINEVLDFEYLFKQQGRDLAEQVIDAATTERSIGLVSDFLTKKILDARIDPISKFVRDIVSKDGQIDLSYMQDQAGLSIKQFERRFKVTAGFTPKHFARIVRFQSAKRKYAAGNFKALAELAHACHYYDQSHFIKDFKEFAGMPPNRYFPLLNKGDGEARTIRDLLIRKEQAGV